MIRTLPPMTGAERGTFVNALRICLGLAPIRDLDLQEKADGKRLRVYSEGVTSSQGRTVVAGHVQRSRCL